MRVAKEKPKKSRGRTKAAPAAFESGSDGALYEALRKYRREMADKRSVPAYVIFTDATLREIAARRPKNLFELMNCRGIGAEKAEKYGRDVVEIVNKDFT